MGEHVKWKEKLSDGLKKDIAIKWARNQKLTRLF